MDQKVNLSASLVKKARIRMIILLVILVGILLLILFTPSSEPIIIYEYHGIQFRG